MVILIKNFNRKECIHYEERKVPSCCGRAKWAGLCVLDDKERTCNKNMAWCRYECEVTNGEKASEST